MGPVNTAVHSQLCECSSLFITLPVFPQLSIYMQICELSCSLTRLQWQMGHDNWVRSVVFHSSGKYIISSSDDKSIRLWSIQLARSAKTISEAHPHFVTSVDFNTKFPIMASASVDMKVHTFPDISSVQDVSHKHRQVKIWECL